MRALTELTLRFIPGMVARRHGGVLNVGSITGYMPGPNVALYSASKAYVRSFTAALGAELAGTGVTVTCLAPGIVRTALFMRTPLGQTRLNKILPRADAAEGRRDGLAGIPGGQTVGDSGLGESDHRAGQRLAAGGGAPAPDLLSAADALIAGAIYA